MTEATVDHRKQYQVGGIGLIFKRLGYSREPMMLALRSFFVFMAVIVGISNIRMWLQSLSARNIFRKDFIQEFLISKSVLDGVNPYLPLSELADRYIGPLPNPVFPHPSAHPPPVVLLYFPLGLLSYEQAAIVWFLFELACISLSVILLLRWLGVKKGAALASLGALLILVWRPITHELILGQLTALLLALLVGTWQALRSRKDILGGIFLGSAIALKLFPWPLIIFLTLRRNWRAACTAITLVVAANVSASMLIGFDRMADYYLKVGMSVSQLFHAHEENFSLWTVGWRVFEGTGSPIQYGVNAPPLFDAPSIAPFFSIALPLAMLIMGLLFAIKARSFDTSFGILVCIMILVSPFARIIYLLPALIPLVIVVRNLSSLNWPNKETNIAVCIGITLFIPPVALHRFMILLNGNGIADGTVPTVSFPVALLSLLPAVGLLGLLWIVWRLERLSSET
jgi:hypothetical protein